MTRLLFRRALKEHQVGCVLLGQHLLIKPQQCLKALELDVLDRAALDLADRGLGNARGLGHLDLRQLAQGPDHSEQLLGCHG